MHNLEVLLVCLSLQVVRVSFNSPTSKKKNFFRPTKKKDSICSFYDQDNSKYKLNISAICTDQPNESLKDFLNQTVSQNSTVILDFSPGENSLRSLNYGGMRFVQVVLIACFSSLTLLTSFKLAQFAMFEGLVLSIANAIFSLNLLSNSLSVQINFFFYIILSTKKKHVLWDWSSS